MKKLVILISVFILTMMTASPAMAGGGKGLTHMTHMTHIYVTNKSNFAIQVTHWAASTSPLVYIKDEVPAGAVEFDIPYEGVKCPNGFWLASWSYSTWWIYTGPNYFDRSATGATSCCYDIHLTINADLSYSWIP